ncbi:hypothetical protein Tco_0737530 [Tanacetum coccineum]
MANLSEDIQCAGSDTRPPMLDRTDFASWQQRIRLYCRGKENEVQNELESILTFHLKIRNGITLTSGQQISYFKGYQKTSTLSSIITLMQKTFGDNVKILLEGSELTKEDRLRDSNYDQLYAYLKQHEAYANENKMMLDRFTQHTVDPLALMSNVSHQQYYSQSSTTPASTYVPPHFADNSQLDSGLSPTDNLIENLTNTLALLTQSYKTYLPQTNNQLRTSSNTRNQATVQDGKLVMGELRTKLGMQIQVKQDRLSVTTTTNRVALDEEQLLFIAGGQDNAVDEETMFMENLSFADLVYDEASLSYDTDILSEYVKDNAVPVIQSNVSSVPNDAYMMIFNDIYEPSAQCVFVTTQNNIVDNLLTVELTTYKEQVELSKDSNTMKSEALKEQTIASRPIKALTVNPTLFKARCLELEAELSKLRDKVQKDDHTELVKHFSNLEVNHLNLQLKYQNLKESFGNNTSPPARDVPDFDSVFVIEKMKASIQGKDNAIKKLRMQISQLKETRSEADRTLDFRALDFQITQLTEKVTVLQEQNELFRDENAKIKQHYKELYDSIKITRAKHIEQTTALLTENENLKAQLLENLKCIIMDSVKPRFLAPGRYTIDVEPLPPHLKKNWAAHLDYLKHLKESVETIREIVEEAKVERPLDRSRVNSLQTNASGFIAKEQWPRIIDLARLNVLSNKKKVVQIVLWYLDSGCSKHMTGDRSRLKNFVKKFIGTLRFRNVTTLELIMSSEDYMNVDKWITVPVLVNLAGIPFSTTIDQDAPSPSHSPSSSALQSLSLQQGVVAESTIMEDNLLAPAVNDPFVNLVAPAPSSETSSSGDVSPAESTYVTQTHHHLGKWSKDHPIDNVIGNPSRPSNQRTSNLPFLKIAGFKPCKIRFTNLTDFKYGN